MRKVHYKVILDVFVIENDNIEVVELLEDADYDINAEEDGFDIHDVSVESVEAIDSR